MDTAKKLYSDLRLIEKLHRELDEERRFREEAVSKMAGLEQSRKEAEVHRLPALPVKIEAFFFAPRKEGFRQVRADLGRARDPEPVFLGGLPGEAVVDPHPVVAPGIRRIAPRHDAGNVLRTLLRSFATAPRTLKAGWSLMLQNSTACFRRTNCVEFAPCENSKLKMSTTF